MAEEKQKQVNIQKLDAVEAVRERIPFTTLSNKVLQNLRDAEALACWCYLQSMPPHWRVIKAAVRKHFDWGVNKVDKVFSTLNKLDLIEFIQERKHDGTLGEFQIVIKSAGLFEEPTGTIETMVPDVTAPMETIGAENHRGGKPCQRFSEAINTIYTNTTEKINTTPTKCVGAFESFWDAYPTKVGKKPCQEKWKQKRLDNHIEEILEKVNQQIQFDDKWQRGYIPNPITYLNQERWKDEVLVSKEEQERIKKEIAKKKSDEMAAARVLAQDEANRAQFKANQSKPSQERTGAPKAFKELVKSMGIKQK